MSNEAYPYMIQGDNIVVVIKHKSYTVSKGQLNYKKILGAIKDGDWETVKNIVDPKKVVLDYGKGHVSIQGPKLFYKDKEIHNSMATRLVNMYEEGFPIEPMVAFLENLHENPSHTAVQELYGFLEKGRLPITSDGHFLAYKKVDAEFKDCYTHTIDNSVGQVVTMERNDVDDDRNRTCSAGLHFCSESYLRHFGGSHTMILKINPRDVVSIPADYNDAKGRCCRYEVIAELGVEASEAFTNPVQDEANTAVAEVGAE